jgi:hypothetical protein
MSIIDQHEILKRIECNNVFMESGKEAADSFMDGWTKSIEYYFGLEKDKEDDQKTNS